jgi:prepilin-type N-terminal cleavage/methylation domain-containing protein
MCKSRSPAFTLIEMMLVTALIGLIIATASIGLGGITERGRLNHFVSQIDSSVQQVRLEAWSTGVPRRLVFRPNATDVSIQRPRKSADGWVWTLSRRFELPRGLLAGGILMRDGSHVETVRVGADGCTVDFACIVQGREFGTAIMVDGWSGACALASSSDGLMDIAELFGPGDAG